MLALAALAALDPTLVAAGTVVGVSMTDPSIVSATAGGELGSGRRLSDDGRWLVFSSQGTELVPGYTGTGVRSTSTTARPTR